MAMRKNLIQPFEIQLSQGSLTLEELSRLKKDALLDFHRMLRYSKQYLNKNLGIKIDRGGLIVIKDQAGKCTVYETVKVTKGYIYPQTEKLGEGGFGVVKKIRNIENLNDIAVIKVPRHYDNDLDLEAMREEAEKQKVLGVSVYSDIIYKKERSEHGKPCLILKLLKGENLEKVLNNDMNSDSKLTIFNLFSIALKTCECVHDLHKKGWLHCDIKPENFMYSKSDEKIDIKLIDAGFMMKIQMEKQDRRVKGTKGFVAPEIMKRKEYSTASDVYALGRVIQDLFNIQGNMVSTIPFGEKKIIGAENLFNEQRDEIRALTKKMLETDPKNRISLIDAINEIKRIERVEKQPQDNKFILTKEQGRDFVPFLDIADAKLAVVSALKIEFCMLIKTVYTKLGETHPKTQRMKEVEKKVNNFTFIKDYDAEIKSFNSLVVEFLNICKEERHPLWALFFRSGNLTTSSRIVAQELTNFNSYKVLNDFLDKNNPELIPSISIHI